MVSSGLSAAKDGWVRICGAGTEHCPKRVPMPDMMAGLKALTQAWPFIPHIDIHSETGPASPGEPGGRGLLAISSPFGAYSALSSKRSILKITGLVPSEQQVIITFS